jgi:hypothetical protein
MSQRTAFLSKFIGLYLTLISLAMAAHKQAALESMTTLIQTPAMLFVVGVIAMAAGLAMVLSHNVWSGGVLPIIVTLTGWLMLVKGSLLLFLPPNAASVFFLAGLHYEQLFNLYVAIALVLGIYLTYGGFKSEHAK